MKLIVTPEDFVSVEGAPNPFPLERIRGSSEIARVAHQVELHLPDGTVRMLKNRFGPIGLVTPAARLGWNDGAVVAAPKDRPIVAVGGVMCEDEFSTTKEPFCQALEWDAAQGEWMLYHRHGDYPMALRRSLEDEVIIHWWTEYPRE